MIVLLTCDNKIMCFEIVVHYKFWTSIMMIMVMFVVVDVFQEIISEVKPKAVDQVKEAIVSDRGTYM